MLLRLVRDFRGRRAGEVHTYPDTQAAKIIESGFGLPEGDAPSGAPDAMAAARDKPRKGKAK
jgi:hypothetical protein